MGKLYLVMPQYGKLMPRYVKVMSIYGKLMPIYTKIWPFIARYDPDMQSHAELWVGKSNEQDMPSYTIYRVGV